MINIRAVILYMSICCDYIFLLGSIARYLTSLWPWQYLNWPVSRAFLFHKHIFFPPEKLSPAPSKK